MELISKPGHVLTTAFSNWLPPSDFSIRTNVLLLPGAPQEMHEHVFDAQRAVSSAAILATYGNLGNPAWYFWPDVPAGPWMTIFAAGLKLVFHFVHRLSLQYCGAEPDSPTKE